MQMIQVILFCSFYNIKRHHKMVYKYFVSIITVAVFKVVILLGMFVHGAGKTAFSSKAGGRGKSS